MRVENVRNSVFLILISFVIFEEPYVMAEESSPRKVAKCSRNLAKLSKNSPYSEFQYYSSIICQKDIRLTVKECIKNIFDLYEFRDPNSDKVLDRNVNVFDSENVFFKLEIIDAKMPIISNGLSKFFPELHSIEIINSGLVILAKENLQQFGENLLEINFSNNFLTELESDLFEFNPKVTKAVFDGNKLKFIGENFLSNIQRKMTLNFYDNDCVDEKFDWNLDDQDYMRNCNMLIEKCKPRPTADETHFNYIEIQEKIESLKEVKIQCVIWKDYPDEIHEILNWDSSESNSFQYITCENFTVIYPQTALIWENSGNQIYATNSSDFKTVLKTSNNAINFLPEGLTLIPNISALIMTNCSLRVLTKIDLMEFGDNLQFCNLSNNLLISLEEDLFIYNRNLILLDLSNNPLKVIGGLHEEFGNNLMKMSNLQGARIVKSQCIDGSFGKIYG